MGYLKRRPIAYESRVSSRNDHQMANIKKTMQLFIMVSQDSVVWYLTHFPMIP